MLAKLRFNALPEDLRVKEAIVNKGLHRKRMRIMGRGRTGMGYNRYANVRIVLEKIDFKKTITDQKSLNQKLKWKKIEKIANDAHTKANSASLSASQVSA